MTRLLPLIFASLLATTAQADDPVVERVVAERSGMGWRIHVTLSHPDSGWDHFADGWEITDAQGNRLGYRELMHPHVKEQPFTRSLFDVMVPDGTQEVFIRSRCSQGKWAKATTRVQLRR